MQIKSNCVRYSITLWKFAKKVKITFGAVAKGDLLPGLAGALRTQGKLEGKIQDWERKEQQPNCQQCLLFYMFQLAPFLLRWHPSFLSWHPSSLGNRHVSHCKKTNKKQEVKEANSALQRHCYTIMKFRPKKSQGNVNKTPLPPNPYFCESFKICFMTVNIIPRILHICFFFTLIYPV